MCMGICLYVSLCTTCVPSALRDQKRMPHHPELELVVTGLGVAIWVLGLESAASRRAASALMAEPSLQCPPPVLCVGFHVA